MKLRDILSKAKLEPSEELKKSCGTFTTFQEVVHLECENMGKIISSDMYMHLVSLPSICIIEPFETFPGLHYGVTEKGMVVGRPVYEYGKCGFDIRSSMELTYETVKHIAVCKYPLL